MNINTILVCVCVCVTWVYKTMGISLLYLNILMSKIGLAQVTKHLIHFAHYSPSILFHNFHNTQYRKFFSIKLLIVSYWTNWTCVFHNNLAYMTNIKLDYQGHQLSKQKKKGKKKEENGKCDL